MGLGGNDGGAHWEVEAQLSGPGDDLDGANRRRGHRRPKVEEELEVDAAGLPAGRGSVRGSRTTSRSSWAQPRGEGVAVAVVVLVGGGGGSRVRGRESRGRRGGRGRVRAVRGSCVASSGASRESGEAGGGQQGGRWRARVPASVGHTPFPCRGGRRQRGGVAVGWASGRSWPAGPATGKWPR